MSQVVVYYEPGAEGEDAVRKEVSTDMAIAIMRRNCLVTRGKDLYKSDQEALEDFIIVNWGWLEDKEEADE